MHSRHSPAETIPSDVGLPGKNQVSSEIVLFCEVLTCSRLKYDLINAAAYALNRVRRTSAFSVGQGLISFPDLVSVFIFLARTSHCISISSCFKVCCRSPAFWTDRRTTKLDPFATKGCSSSPCYSIFATTFKLNLIERVKPARHPCHRFVGGMLQPPCEGCQRCRNRHDNCLDTLA